MTNTQRRTDFLGMLSTIIQFAEENCIEIICADFWRSTERQKELFDAGKSKCDGVSTKSQHQLWLAVDLYIIDGYGKLVTEETPDYIKMGERWESMGGVWGGRWPSLHDIFHFEYGQDDD
jgi:hypothetical protein